ncbi:KpsF/GutQ family sugar-phosphate isomerase [Anabaena sp. CCY 0017]|uniref:KpsF/GutQ family sugar-phosphate isomerase n=1 Tax=Anabaena sp. CCY 0017 TaxID=3103866 RepID=UPI0039C628E1
MSTPLLETAKEVIKSQIQALQTLLETVNEEVESAAQLIQKSKGRVIVTGVGKSGHIGRKIAATLASTGTPAFFLHAAEGNHGDLGMITSDDIVIAISKSGRTEEVMMLIPYIHKIGAKIIAFTADPISPLSKYANVTLDIGVRSEVAFLQMVPTNTTTASLVLGDALAIALSVARDFTFEEYAIFHPGGSIGVTLTI